MLGRGERGEDTSSAWKIEIEVPEPFSSGPRAFLLGLRRTSAPREGIKGFGTAPLSRREEGSRLVFPALS